MKINISQLTKTFIKMVSVSSESGSENEFAKYIVDYAKKMGAKTKTDKFGNVYINFKGKGEKVMLNTHMDTVSPGVGIKAKVSGKYVVGDGSTILGADSKAGIAAMFEAIKFVKENKIPHKDVEITLTRNEESGIPTADKIHSDVKVCLVPDRGTPLGEIIIEAPYAQVFQVNIKGKTAYGPTSYSQGKHAIDSAISILKDLPRGDIDNQTTVNIGIINGGEMTSMVPENCIFKGSCYSFSKGSLNNFIKKLKDTTKIVDEKYGTKTQVSMLEYFGGFNLKRNDPLVKLAKRAISQAGIKPVYKVYKAVTNANLLNQIGIKTVLISTGVENQHTTRERISVKTLENLTKVLINFLTTN